MIVGLTGYATKGHIARAALEATAWQSKEVVDAANAVADVPFDELRVDGGMTVNELLMQFQADVLGVPVIRPKVTETTALGAGLNPWGVRKEELGALGRGQALGARDGRRGARGGLRALEEGRRALADWED